MNKLAITAAAVGLLGGIAGGQARAASPNYNDIQTVVVIFLENRSFDSVFGQFPGANGLSRASATSIRQRDRDGTVLSGLPPVAGGLNAAIAAGAPVAPGGYPSQAATGTWLAGFNHPFSIESLYRLASPANTNPLRYTNRDLYHRFYEHRMQINGGANDMFAAWADSGGLAMMYIPNNNHDHPLWRLARTNVLADNFFQPAFGGSYLNHHYLICSCAPIYPAKDGQPFNPHSQAAAVYNGVAAARGSTAPAPSALTGDKLTTSASSPASAMNGPPAFVNSSVITPLVTVNGAARFWSINTQQPPFPPSTNATNKTGPQTAVNLDNPSTLPPQTQTTIGDLLTNAGVDWAYYAGAWNHAIDNPPYTAGASAANPNFQYHHQPFNYYERFDPARPAGMTIQTDPEGTPVYRDGAPVYVPSTEKIYTNTGAAERAAHLLDAGVSGPPYTSLSADPGTANPGAVPFASSRFGTDIARGRLPPVTFYKPHGTVNEHGGYANVTDGDRHIAAVIAALRASPQYAHMLILITWDEYGGIWDHVAPPTGDYFGPGSRVPAIIVSPYARKKSVDHTQYDTTSVLRFIVNKYGLPQLPGITLRDNSLRAHGFPAMGDLTGALNLP